ncbi:DUF177 domain-containing protein [Bradyrhizobium sp.]|uniref:YceD family protein n=1 Tax=Bradyrhizobium sp. TaxID=376 RepID=UPI001ED28A63|nr:DUF177 domain-containing protein [Bradyrhizobium sp.]MBV9981235.1 DUF177 domain-containing protein [Bradyrhizobium sp.]
MKKRDGIDTRADPPADPSTDPWRAPVVVAQIPETGLAVEIDASAAQRKAMAEIAGLRDIASARASFELTLARGGRVHVAGRLQARVGQTCVVTLDPIENDIDEAIDLVFAPPEQIKELADFVDQADNDDDADVPEPPEPIESGVIDLGRLATDVLFLAIDPYPRKQDAVFEPRVAAPDPEEHPFAALKALQRPHAEKTDSRKPDEARPEGKKG